MQLALTTTKARTKEQTEDETRERTKDRTKDPDWRCVEVYIRYDPPGGGGRVEFDPGFRNATPIALRRNLSFPTHDSTVQTYEILCKRCNTQQ